MESLECVNLSIRITTIYLVVDQFSRNMLSSSKAFSSDRVVKLPKRHRKFDLYKRASATIFLPSAHAFGKLAGPRAMYQVVDKRMPATAN